MSRPRGDESNQHADEPPRQPKESTAASPSPTSADPRESSSRGIDRLLDHASSSGAVERAAVDPEFATRVVRDIKPDYVLHAASEGDWATAMSMAYSNARKAVTMLLMAHGWRVPDQPGKHAKIVEAVDAWLSAEHGSGPRLAGSYARSRKARNNEEYPDSRAPLPDADALRQLTLDNMRLVRRVRVELGLSDDETIVPNDDNIERWRSRQT